MLEVTATDIGSLNDTDLRSLIALLCESEMIKLEIPTSGVTWGGHQNAKDGGVDVRVHYDLGSIEGYVPRNNTCFQVKKPDMPRSAIIDEMSPKGQLRGVIKQLIDLKGAYIIVRAQQQIAP